jgi:alkylhydroperoxidase family enzyme
VIAHTPKAVSDELFARMKAEFTEEQIVAITTMGVMMTAMNYFNDILQIEPE